jgi:hypothetical protein
LSLFVLIFVEIVPVCHILFNNRFDYRLLLAPCVTFESRIPAVGHFRIIPSFPTLDCCLLDEGVLIGETGVVDSLIKRVLPTLLV